MARPGGLPKVVPRTHELYDSRKLLNGPPLGLAVLAESGLVYFWEFLV